MSTRKPKKANDAAELLPDPDAIDKLTTFFDSLGPDRSAAVSLYAVDPNNRLRRSFLLKIPDVAELTGPEFMEQVLAAHGPGEYFAQTHDEATGQIIFSQRFEVGPIKRGPVIPVATPATPAAKAGDTSSELAAALNRQSALLEALLNRKEPTALERLRELKELRELFAPPAAPAAPAFDLAKLLELVNGVATLRDTLGGDGDTGGPLAVLARSLAPALTKIAERAVDTPALPAPASPAAGVTVTTPASSSSSAPAGGANVNASETMLKVYVSELVRFAESGLEPSAAIERVAQTLAGFPESTVGQVLDWLDDERAFDKLVAIEPKAAPHKDWLEAVIDGVLELATDAEEPAPAAAPANGATQPAAAGG